MRLVEECEMERNSDPELVLYRDRTFALLKKFFRMSMELGHLPSLLGKEFFRTHVTNYGTWTFEDAVIFVHDVERCLETLNELEGTVIARIVFQQYTTEEASALLNCSPRTMDRLRGEALDAASAVFLKRGMLRPVLAMRGRRAEVTPEERVTNPGQRKPMGTVRDIRAMAILA